MKILDIDIDYFMDEIAFNIGGNFDERLSESDYGSSVWSEKRVIDFIENQLGLSKTEKIKGRIVSGHNEALFFWKELIQQKKLICPFEVVHIDSHADLGLGYSSWHYILEKLLTFPKDERPKHNSYLNCDGNKVSEGIGDYLLFAIAYQWISKLTYCANPHGDKNDYFLNILKNNHEEYIWDKPVSNVIQLVHNEKMARPEYDDSEMIKQQYFETADKDPEIPFTIIPTVKDVKYDGNFDFIVIAQSPNYTPASADFILDIFRDYIEEI